MEHEGQSWTMSMLARANQIVQAIMGKKWLMEKMLTCRRAFPMLL